MDDAAFMGGACVTTLALRTSDLFVNWLRQHGSLTNPDCWRVMVVSAVVRRVRLVDRRGPA